MANRRPEKEHYAMWTVNDVLALRPCEDYGRERLTELWDGRESLGIGEVCDLSIPPMDRVWLLTKAPFEVIEPAITRIVERAVRNYALGSAIDEWAQKWLSGEDRTSGSANTAVARAFACACAAAAADPATDWAADRAADWATDWAADWAADSAADWADSATDRAADRAADWAADWATDWATDWAADSAADWADSAAYSAAASAAYAAAAYAAAASDWAARAAYSASASAAYAAERELQVEDFRMLVEEVRDAGAQ